MSKVHLTWPQALRESKLTEFELGGLIMGANNLSSEDWDNRSDEQKAILYDEYCSE